MLSGDARRRQRRSPATDHDIWAVNVESVYHEEQTDADHEQPYREVPETEYVSEPLAERAA